MRIDFGFIKLFKIGVGKKLIKIKINEILNMLEFILLKYFPKIEFDRKAIENKV